MDNLSQEQTEILKGNRDIAWMALEQSRSALYERNRQRVFLTKTDSTGMTMMGKVTEGRLPQEENEVAAERWTLLNLGIEPVVNKSFTVLDQDTGQEKQLLLTGILTDIYANKKYGLLSLYGTLDREKQGTYLAYLKFQDNTDYEEEVKDLEQKLGVTEKDIKDCPARTDLRKLYDTEIKVLGCLFLVCIDWFEIQKAKSKNGMLLRLSCKYIIRDRRTSGFLLLMISVAAVLFTCLAYKAHTLEIYRQDTREMYYLNGDYAMTMLYFDQTEQGLSRENAEQIQELPEVSSVKTSSSLPIRVVDEENVDSASKQYTMYVPGGKRKQQPTTGCTGAKADSAGQPEPGYIHQKPYRRKAAERNVLL